MLKNFKKYKSIVLMIAVYFNLFWAGGSLAGWAVPIEPPKPTVMEIMLPILNWILSFILLAGIIGICVSGILFVIDFFKKRKMKNQDREMTKNMD